MSAADARSAAAAIRRGRGDRHLLLLSDFDGTLAGFEADPEAVALPPARRALLEALARQDGVTIGLVSGRRLADVRDRAALAVDACYAGLHGLEIDCGDERFVHPAVEATRDLLQELASTIDTEVRKYPGAFVENKGLSMAAHFRGASPEHAARVTEFVDALAQLHVEAGTLRVMRGACLLELLPNIDWHKGSAVDWIYAHAARRHGAIFAAYMGDDVTDEDAFRALRGRGVSVAVSPRAKGADLAIDGPEDVEVLLRALTDEMRQGS
jgi:trehalose 6-phosphate phosphatase